MVVGCAGGDGVRLVAVGGDDDDGALVVEIRRRLSRDSGGGDDVGVVEMVYRIWWIEADLLISYGLLTLQRTTGNDMRNFSNLVAAQNELLRPIAEKEELIRVYRAM
nr:hypothetical protein [Tanacetum cinerariifolium]